MKINLRELIEFCKKNRELANEFFSVECVGSFPADVHRYDVCWKTGEYLFSFSAFGWERKVNERRVVRELIELEGLKPHDQSIDNRKFFLEGDKSIIFIPKEYKKYF